MWRTEPTGDSTRGWATRTMNTAVPKSDKSRSGRLRCTLGLLGLLLAAGWLALSLRAVMTAKTEMEAGIKIVGQQHATETSADPLEARVRTLAAAGRRFARARGQLDVAFLAPARHLPFIGRQLRSASALSVAAIHATEIGVDAGSHLERLSKQANGSGLERVTVVRSLAGLADDAERRLKQIDLGPGVALIPPLASAREEMAERLANITESLRRTSAGARTVADFLVGPRRYLVLVTNNAEMRAGSGMVLALGELETSGGAVRFGGTRSVDEVVVPPDSVHIEGDFADRWGWLKPAEAWWNLMASPRFDVSASLAAQMWVAAGNPPVDGVMAVDSVALRGVLEATGPLNVNGTVFTADNVLDELLHDQYLRFPGIADRPERVEIMGRVAETAFAALDGGRWSFPALVSGLAGPVQGRHLMLWSARPAEQEGWHRAGVDGGIQANSLLVSVLNRGGNKLDLFLSISANLDCTGSRKLLDCALRLSLENTVPPGEPSYIAGPHRDSPVGKGTYLGIVAVTLPGAAADGRIEGVERLAVGGPDGPSRVVGYQLDVARGERREVVVRFGLPGPQPLVRVEPSARRPSIAWSSGGRSWLDTSARLVAP